MCWGFVFGRIFLVEGIDSQEYRVLEPLSGSATTAIVGFDPALGKAFELG